MKVAIKTIVDSIEKEVNYIIENYNNFGYDGEKDFEYGTFKYEMQTINKKSIGGEWDEILNETFIKIEVQSVDVTNENSKTLTNLSNEVFNQLETSYTNY